MTSSGSLSKVCLCLLHSEVMLYQMQVAESEFHRQENCYFKAEPCECFDECSWETPPDKVLVTAAAQRTCFDDYMIQRSSLDLTWIDCTASSRKHWECHPMLRKIYSVSLSIDFSSGTRAEYKQRHFFMKKAQIVSPRRDDKAEFGDISALEHN